MISKDVLDQWKQWAKRDDWHLYFVGSDVRQMLGEIERLRTGIDGAVQTMERGSTSAPVLECLRALTCAQREESKP